MTNYIQKLFNSSFFNGPNAPLTGHYEPGQGILTFITGQNASGKSLARKMLNNYYHDDKIEYIHISQEGRTCSSGLQRAMVYGDETEDSTGYTSARIALKAIKTSENRTTPHAIFLDEPDIGLSDEYTVSLGMKISEYCSSPNPFLVGFWVVTHNKLLVQTVSNPHHLRIGDKKTLKEWLHGPIIPADLDDLEKQGKNTYFKINEILNNIKKNKK